jgi:hypothetical protein
MFKSVSVITGVAPAGALRAHPAMSTIDARVIVSIRGFFTSSVPAKIA